MAEPFLDPAGRVCGVCRSKLFFFGGKLRCPNHGILRGHVRIKTGKYCARCSGALRRTSIYGRLWCGKCYLFVGESADERGGVPA